MKKLDTLYSTVVEVEERIIPEWPEFLPPAKPDSALIETTSGVTVRELTPLNVSLVKDDLARLYAEGYRSLAIVFAHSYLHPAHEHQVADIARSMGFGNVSVSSDLDAKIGFIARGQSATADAYLTPEVRRYLDGFAKGFKGRLEEETGCRVSFMQSDGALADFRKFGGLRAILCETVSKVSERSGPDNLKRDRLEALSALLAPRMIP